MLSKEMIELARDKDLGLMDISMDGKYDVDPKWKPEMTDAKPKEDECATGHNTRAGADSEKKCLAMAGCVYDKPNDKCKSGSDKAKVDAKSTDSEKLNTIVVKKDETILIRPRGEVKDAADKTKKAVMYGKIDDVGKELLITGAIGAVIKTDSTITFEAAEVDDSTGKISVGKLEGKVDANDKFIVTNVAKGKTVLL